MNRFELVFITGMSGSGKSVALHALEDSGFYCVDNLPPELVLAFIDLQRLQASPLASTKLAIAVDVRSAKSLPALPAVLSGLEKRGAHYKLLFLDASNDTLIHRYSESRRLHPLSNSKNSDKHLALQDAILLERDLLSDIRERAHLLDTSLIKSAQLQSQIKNLIESSKESETLTVVFESFAFKRGVPLDADYVFDVRMLPNPHYEPALKILTGRDEPVINFLAGKADVTEMQKQITAFVTHWLPAMRRDHRSYVTVAIGCTGGQHRSVYLVEQLAKAFEANWPTLKRHRELG
jgi:RNase adapter protein RapZ